MEAQFKQGTPIFADYTPGSAVSAGDVVVVGTLPLVAHRDIASGAKGALAAGGGIYKMTADGALAAGAKVYWDESEGKVSATSTDNTAFGYVAPNSSSAADDDPIEILHRPGA